MKRLVLLIFMSLMVHSVWAQRTVTGTIVDTDNIPIIGASVLVKGTTKGDVSNVDGNYTVEVPDGSNTLVISYTGYSTQEIDITGQSVVDVVLSEGVELGEVVVTGLGIKREKKALGYGVSTIATDAIANRQEADVARILRGKATGVDITQTSGLAGSGTNIIIRGYSSITGSNQPLFVIDGVPFNSSTNSDSGSGSGGATASSRFLDLDPNTIEEVSILKGLSATVLYGEAGRNGVVLVTTKAGSAGASARKGLEVSLSQSFAQSHIANLPDYQNSFGNGFNAGFGWYFSNWGPAFSDLKESSYGSNFKGIKDGKVLITHPLDQSQYHEDFPEYKGAEYFYQPYKSVEKFFEKPGLTSNTSLSIQKSINENTSVSASYSYLSDEGFTPRLDEMRGGGASNYINKHNFGLGARTKLENGLMLKGSFNYVDLDRRAPITGFAFGGDGNGLFAALLFTPRSVDLMNMPYQSPIDGRNVYYRRGSAIQNPRWVLNNAGEFEGNQRFFSTTEASYDLTDNIKLLYRLGLDSYAQNNRREQNKGGSASGSPDGFMRTSARSVRTVDHLFNVGYNYGLTEDWTLDGIVGFNMNRRTWKGSFTSATQQFVYGLFTHNNFINHSAFSARQEENTLGLIATATAGFRNYLYINAQVRNDWTSTLEKENRSIAYPSFSVSFVPTDAFASLQNNNILNYLKLRVGYGTSAGYPDPYQTRSVLSTYTNGFQTAGGTVINGNTVSDQLGNKNLKPEIHAELEGGIEARFFDNRLGVDLSLFNKDSRNLIIALPLDPATGYSTTTVNAASLNNKGVELGLNVTPLRGKFGWDFTLNYTKQISEVTKIQDGVDQVRIAGGSGQLANYAIKGQPFGIIQGSEFKKDDNGNYIVDEQGNYSAASGLTVIGDPNPDFTANWINNFSFAGLSFGFQWSYQHGGDIFSSTVQAMLARGNTVDTDVDRFVPVIFPGVKSDGSVNDIQTYMGDSFFRAYFFANEGGIFDATNIRLREVSLAYLVPQSLLSKTPFGRASLTLSGQNLWYNAPNFPKGINFDPEVLSVGIGNARGFDFRTAPTSKRYGLTLNLTF